MSDDVTRILSAIENGEEGAADRLLPLVYEELRKLAASKMSRELAGQTLQATALVHEAYLRLVDQQQSQHWDSRGHFFKAAAEAMRRILIERARRKKRLKHGGDRQRVDLTEDRVAVPPTQDLLTLDDALSKLAEQEPTKAELVKLRFYAGMTISEAAELLGMSHATAERYWSYARSWLYCELQDEPEKP